MNPLSPKQILRNLENGFFMTHQEQTEAAQLIRQLQESNKALMEGMLLNAETIVRLRRMIQTEVGLDRATQLLGDNNDFIKFQPSRC